VTDIRPVDPFAPGSAAVAVLLALRLTGLVLIAPVFSAKMVPATVKTALVVLFTILIQPMAYAAVQTPPRITPATALGEVIIGFAIGLGAALIVGAAEAAGDLLAIQIGLSGASLLDPLNNASTPVAVRRHGATRIQRASGDDRGNRRKLEEHPCW